MARSKREIDFSMMNPKQNLNIAKNIQNNINDIYRNTYYSDNKDSSYIENIRRKVDLDLNYLQDKNKIRNNGVNISDLYAKTLAKTDEGVIRELKGALQDESMITDIMDMYSKNAVLRDLDREIDVVCKYMPKLDQALDIKADHVMSADHFNNDPLELTVNNNDSNSSTNSSPKFGQKSDLDSFKEKYDIYNKARKWYDKAAKYGECFVYVTSYNKAIKRLMQRSGKTGLMTESAIIEAVEDCNKTINLAYTINESKELLLDNYSTLSEGYNDIEVEINTSGVIPSILTQQTTLRRVLRETTTVFSARGVKSDDTLLSNVGYLKNMNKQFKQFSKEGGSLKQPTALAIDGFTDKEKQKKDFDKIDVVGAVVKVLDRCNTKPLYIDDICLGYYYIETNGGMKFEEQTTFTSTLGGLRPRRSTRDREDMDKKSQTDDVLIKIARRISQKIDANFINANQALTQEIYAILKYNVDHGGNSKVGKIRVTFIPPEDVVQVAFDINENTHRGRSDLYKSLFPAKLYSCLYISNTIALLTRGYDKRIYQVRQTVDTNISGVLMNVINQIKQSNFNLRQIENMNNIMNITGRFNDLVIPQNANGESPINFEVLPGQNIEIKTEHMNSLEEMAVDLTGVTIEMLNSRKDEQTATHITMTNSRFLMKIYARQQAYQKLLSLICTKIYQAEYDTTDTIEVKLPPPAFLNFTNVTQLLGMGGELINNIVQMKMGAEQDEEIKAEFIGKLMRYYYETFLPMDEIDKLADEAKIEVEARRPSDQVAAASMPQQGGTEAMPNTEPPQMGEEQPQY